MSNRDETPEELIKQIRDRMDECNKVLKKLSQSIKDSSEKLEAKTSFFPDWMRH